MRKVNILRIKQVRQNGLNVFKLDPIVPPMRAETQAIVDHIEESLDLLRRSL